MPRRHHIAATALVAAATLIIVAADDAYAEIYKLIDKDGRATYSNTPMPGATKTALDNPPAPSEEDVRAAQESNRQIETLVKEMEERRLRLEEQRARLNMEERMYDAYLKQLREPVPDYDPAWLFAIGGDVQRTHFNHFPRVHDRKRHRSPVHMHVGMGKKPQKMTE